MDESTYIKTRVDDQIDWYDHKSLFNQRCFKILRIIEVCAAAAIPFLSGYITDITPGYKIFVGLLGVIIAVIAAIVSIYKFQENWVEYRTVCESLRHEKLLYLTKTEPYNCDSSFSLLVQRIESMISKENSSWSQYIKPTSKEKCES